MIVEDLVLYLRYVVVGGASAALSWTHGYAKGYKLARNNELKRVRERQRKRFDYQEKKATGQRARRSLQPQVRQRSYRSRRR